jgi:GTPase SAR1 family protein
MTEGQGVTAASAPWGGGEAGAAPVPEPVPGSPDPAAAGPPQPARPAQPGYRAARGPSGVPPEPAIPPGQPVPAVPAGPGPAGAEPVAEPYVRVDARRLESALLALRHPIVAVPLVLEAPGVQQARAERRKLLSQIDDYLLPRLRQSGAPILVALVGSTGAGKSTLMNSLVGRQVSLTGIRRPTTNSPVLACHPDDAHWFAENVFLPTLPRVRQQGLAMPGRDGLLVLAASEGMPRGVALLDTPDIDSVVAAHRDFAHQFLDASDLWLFMTSARRYADAAVWELLQDARDRGASLAVVLSRVPAAAASQLTAHFDAMLQANGLPEVTRFLVPETMVTDARLPAEVSGPVRDWLEDTADRMDRRVAVLTQTMSGVLDTFRTRVPQLAAEIEAQLALRLRLHDSARNAYRAALAGLDRSMRDGSLLTGEVLARWQDFAGTGDLMRTLHARKGRRGGGRGRKRTVPARATALQAAVASGMESLVAALADRAAEQAVGSWQALPAGTALLAGLNGSGSGGPRPGSRPDQPPGRSGGQPPGMSGLTGLSGHAQLSALSAAEEVAALARSSPDLGPQSARAIGAWQEHVLQLVQAENVTRRSVARVVSFDEEALALVLTIVVLGQDATQAEAGASAVPQRLLASLFGAGLLRDIGNRVRADLCDRIGLLFDDEMLRFTAIADAAGVPDETAATQLHEASIALEAAR